MKNLVEELEKYETEASSEFFSKYRDTVDLSFGEFSEIHDDYVVADFWGGLNGNGKWTDYIQAISELITLISSDYHCWLVSLENDCLDDLFVLKLGIKYKE